MPESAAFLLRIRHFPQPLEARELMEVALAGASLDIDLAVLFEDAALAFLMTPAAAGWRQLHDFDLAPVCVPAEAAAALELPAWVLRLDAAQLRDMASSRRMLPL